MDTPLIAAFATAAALFSFVVPNESRADTLTGLTADVGMTGTVSGDGSAGNVTLNGVSLPNQFVGRVSTGSVGVMVFVFQLPTLSAGQTIDTASFTFVTVTNNSALSANIDLYGLGYRTTSTVTKSDYFTGSSGSTDTTDATMLQDNLFTTGTLVANNTAYTTNSGGSVALTSYLNSQYTAGAVGGNYVFLRLNYDDWITNNQGRIDVATADYATDSVHIPYITYSISSIPEPSAAALLMGALSLGFVAAVQRRKRAI